MVPHPKRVPEAGDGIQRVYKGGRGEQGAVGYCEWKSTEVK